MALRGTTGAATTGTDETSISLSYVGSAIEVNDLLLLYTLFDTGGAEGSIYDPSGFTAGATIGLADMNYESAVYAHIAVRIATSADVGNPTYVTGFGNSSRVSQQLRVYSGRLSSSIAAAFPRTVETAVGSAQSFPYTFPVTGLTADAGDDLVLFIGSVPSAALASGQTFSAAASGFANLLSTVESGSGVRPIALSIDAANYGGGATGTISANLTSSASYSGLEGAMLLALPASATPPPNPSRNLPLLGVGAVYPLAWIIERRQRRALERCAPRLSRK